MTTAAMRALTAVAARLREDDGINVYVSEGLSPLVADLLDAEAAKPEPSEHALAIAAKVLVTEPWLTEDAA